MAPSGPSTYHRGSSHPAPRGSLAPTLLIFPQQSVIANPSLADHSTALPNDLRDGRRSRVPQDPHRQLRRHTQGALHARGSHPDTRSEESSTLKVRPLIVDGRQKEWTTGDTHDVTDRSFVIRRALRINDSLPADGPDKWVWQPGPWLLVDRVTGHITALHLPDFDAAVSNVVWFRDYAAYCGIATTAKGGLYGVVAQLGARKAVAQRQIGKWPQLEHASPPCQLPQWQRLPMRVTLRPTGGEPFTLDVIGSTSLIEEGDNDDS